MTDATVDRRKLLLGMGAAGGALATLAVPSPAMAAERHRDVTGSWLVKVTGQTVPPYRAVWSFADGGVLISSDQRQTGQGGETAGHQTSGQGVWESDRRLGFRAKYVKWGSTPDVMHFAMLVHEFSGSLDVGLNAFDVTGTLTIIAAATGQVLTTDGFTAHGDRMVLA